MIGRNPDSGASDGPLPSAAGDSSFDFRWIPEPHAQAQPTPLSSAGSGASAPAMSREDSQNRIVIALTIACTTMALLDLFLLASGL